MLSGIFDILIPELLKLLKTLTVAFKKDSSLTYNNIIALKIKAINITNRSS